MTGVKMQMTGRLLQYLILFSFAVVSQLLMLIGDRINNPPLSIFGRFLRIAVIFIAVSVLPWPQVFVITISATIVAYVSHVLCARPKKPSAERS